MRFFWVASSPSPAEVAKLEATFSEVVTLPTEELKAEVVGWKQMAILARSFQRWTTNGPLRAKYNTKMAGMNAPIAKPKGSKKLKDWDMK